MAYYTYDEEADALYILVVPDEEAIIDRTEELAPNIHVDLDPAGKPVGVEILYPSGGGVDLSAVNDRYGLELKIPFNFAA
jgi:uncharacterized protein YuzE